MSTNIAAHPAPSPPSQAVPAGDERFGEYSNSVGISLAADPAHVATARRRVMAQLRHWNLGHLAEDAALITSELVTNAVLYGGTAQVTVRLTTCGAPAAPQLLITVADESTADAVLVTDAAAYSKEHGRGLHILQCLANCWGTAKTNGGKLVWATLAVCASAHESGAGREQSPCCAGSQLALAFARTGS